MLALPPASLAEAGHISSALVFTLAQSAARSG